jgi:hypothetical protein
MSAALLGAFLSSAAAQSLPGGAPGAPSGDAISAARVSQGLQAQPRLQMPLPSDLTPTFRVEVQAPRLETVLDAVRRELGANPREHSNTPLPGTVWAAEVDVLPAIVGLVRQLQRARRERSERRIHDEVIAKLAAFCVVNDCAATNEGLLLPDGN